MSFGRSEKIGTSNNSAFSLVEDYGNLPFDMPKLVRRKQLMEQVRIMLQYIFMFILKNYSH